MPAQDEPDLAARGEVEQRALFVVALATPFMPIPPSPAAFALEALAGYVVLSIGAHVVDRARAAK